VWKGVEYSNTGHSPAAYTGLECRLHSHGQALQQQHWPLRQRQTMHGGSIVASAERDLCHLVVGSPAAAALGPSSAAADPASCCPAGNKYILLLCELWP